MIFNLYKNTNIHRIYALTSVKNVASIKGLHKVGFKKEGVPAGFMGLDCGTKSQELNRKAVRKAKTIIWNGPMVSMAH